MRKRICLILLISCAQFSMSVLDGSTSHFFSKSPLSGNHILVNSVGSVLNYNMIRNATGHIIQTSGATVEILHWLSIAYNFTYSPLQINQTGFEPSKDRPGLVNYILEGGLDIALTIVPTNSRVALVDFTHTVNYAPASYLIPTPDSTLNPLALFQPFSLWVWLEMMATIIAVLLSLFLIAGLHYSAKMNQDDTNISDGNTMKPIEMLRNRIGNKTLLVFALLLKQGDLTSYLSTTNALPLIKSIENIRNRPDIQLITWKDKNTDALLSSAESGFMKELGDKLRAYTFSRCPSAQQCVDLVKSGFHVYIDARDAALMGAMLDDFRATGTCNMELGKEVFILRSAWALKKKSPYINPINKGLMNMREVGFLYLWNSQYTPMARQCLEKKNTKQVEFAILQLKTMAAVFYALFAGIVVSLLVFILELFCAGSKK